MDATPVPASAPLPSARLGLRSALLVALLGLESLALSILVDLPAEGPAHGFAEALRVLFPVALAAVGAGLVVLRARGPRAAAVPVPAEALPPWRPFPAIGLHALAFGATVAAGLRLLPLARRRRGRGRSPAGSPAAP